MKRKPTKLEAKVASLEKSVEKLTKMLNNNTLPSTFEDCLDNFEVSYYGTVNGGVGSATKRELRNGVAVPSEKRARQLAAIAQMMTVADALNQHSASDEHYYIISYDRIGQKPTVAWAGGHIVGMVKFATDELAEKAIKILGTETIKTALGI